MNNILRKIHNFFAPYNQIYPEAQEECEHDWHTPLTWEKYICCMCDLELPEDNPLVRGVFKKAIPSAEICKGIREGYITPQNPNESFTWGMKEDKK